MNDILDFAVSLSTEREPYKNSKPCIDFLSSVICYVNDDVLDTSEITKEVYKDIFQHFGMRYDIWNFNKETKVNFPIIVYDTGEFSYVFQYVKESIYKNPNFFQNLIEDMSKKLKINCRYAVDFPERAGKSLLAIFFCLEVFLNKFPYFTPLIIKKLMTAVSCFICWPDPVGTHAKLIYDKMICENLFPSINQFNFLRKTFPSNDYFNPFLRDIGEEEGREVRLEAMLFSDTSETVSQIIN